MPAETTQEQEAARSNFVHLCSQYQRMGVLLEGMAWHLHGKETKASKHLSSIIDQHHQMGEQLKAVCGGLESLCTKELNAPSLLTRDPNDN